MSNLKSQIIIGLEVHVELTTKSKMFCGCPADHFGKVPNTQTCPVCLGLPGALPVPNQKAIEDTIKIGLALNCQINEVSHFDRKNYFYPDLPKGYQISQYTEPFCHDGFVTLDSGKKIRIERVHLEEDTGKLQHTTLNDERVSLIDFNRSGVPLVEIVSQPDIASSEEAKEYLKKIHAIVKEIGVTTADLEKGQMRLEPTVNLDINGHFTPLVELKNINSFNFAALAIDYEVSRQTNAFETDGLEKSKSNKQTRGYDSVKKTTFLQRQKEAANDYRYFPEPDIPPLRISPSVVEKLRGQLPQLPDTIISDLIAIGVKPADALILSRDKTALAILKNNPDVQPRRLSNLIINKKIDITGNIKAQFEKLTAVGETDAGKLTILVDEVLSQNPKIVEEYKKGKTAVLGFLVGAVMKLSQGQADAQTVSGLLLEKLR
ncbi:Asp-tRNA(Asn)/Glu-tRNA(Gln) amidotransferase subunit GatB [Candidatus Collierbacteria bacterium]|nr:Asp-tRNA(Asn)/Glu-tRNA(Gln) amidotransferase subunit GatB [Candidatus Collierbacteria bacterium]